MKLNVTDDHDVLAFLTHLNLTSVRKSSKSVLGLHIFEHELKQVDCITSIFRNVHTF